MDLFIVTITIHVETAMKNVLAPTLSQLVQSTLPRPNKVPGCPPLLPITEITLLLFK